LIDVENLIVVSGSQSGKTYPNVLGCDSQTKLRTRLGLDEMIDRIMYSLIKVQ